MKIVYSLWTAPYVAKGTIKTGNFGFLSRHYFACSALLSVRLAKKHGYTTELVTDDLGKQILIDELNLPFDRVVLALNELQAPPTIWMAGKLVAYALQQEPFLHCDFDAFLFAPIDDYLARCGGIAYQSNEPFRQFNYYENGIRNVLKLATYLPKEFIGYEKDNCYQKILRGVCFLQSQADPACVPYRNRMAICAGVFGGSDIKAINDYASKALAMIERNDFSSLSAGELNDLNIVIEQYFAASYCLYHGIKLVPYFKNVYNDAETYGKFSHALADAKRQEDTCQRIEAKLKQLFPTAHDRLCWSTGEFSATDYYESSHMVGLSNM